MMQGILIYNGSLTSEKFTELNEMYVEAAKQQDVHLKVMKNTELISVILDHAYVDSCEGIDFVLFLDKDIRLARQLECMGIRVFNSSHTIEVCDDKIWTMQALSKHGIKMPKTIFSHKVYFPTQELHLKFVERVEALLEYPFVIKEAFGSFGKQVYLVETREAFLQKCGELSFKPFLCQELVKTSYGRDVRIQVVDGEVVAAVLRESENDFRANVSNGGKMYPYHASESFQRVAKEVAKILNADFAGVDLLFGEAEEPILCEVNSNAHIKNLYDCTGINVANKIVEYIKRECKGEKRNTNLL